MNVSVETIDDCFQDMQKLRYGARVLIKTTDDESCDDPRFSDTCQNLFEENKVIMEDTCVSPRYEKILFHKYIENIGRKTISFKTVL